MVVERYSEKLSASVVGGIAVLTVLVITVACSSAPQDAPETAGMTPTPADVRAGTLQRTPYPYTTPLPPAVPTVLDGIYVKFDPRPGERAPCRRCPPYPPEGGIWRLSLDEGVFRVYHDGTGWATLGSFTVQGDRIEFFNDPHCIWDVGIYTWKLEGGSLSLEAVTDGCGFDLRRRNLTTYPWASCRPPSTEAAITGHWPAPSGCDGDWTTLEEPDGE